ncbi:Bug family tripartite tricarboxylate transporter substrate binding protein [Pigmentiphaga litoralis]|uniref:Bug family tripartite tricarboxylate transporter substrate binding protein n=1 Tax=Pigmentiphaga litoralis TaxID=516702 RepID=UPI003B43C012
MRHPLLLATLAAALSPFISSFVHAQGAVTYPTKPVKIVVGWSAGGVADVAARVFAQRLSTLWGQQVQVENRPGGGGIIASGVVARAPADGYTLQMVAASEITISPFVRDDLPYSYDKDFVPVFQTTLNPIVLAIHANSPYKTLNDVITAAKAAPGKISYSTAGNGSNPHLAVELFSDEAGISLKHVPYKGGGPASVAAAGGEVVLGAMAISSALPYVKAGTLRVLGVTGTQRLASLPDWPTLAEQGYKNAALASVWTGLYVKAGTPAAIQQKLAADFAVALADPSVKGQLENLGAEPGGATFGTFGAAVKAEAARNEAIVRKANIRPD